ncbi:phosphatase PAP2 family protein [Candidatus Daviesbacteria bacterium]|nr:phosphatase PAP2 family protein [Candidatus Daviesbacteria bacterium]
MKTKLLLLSIIFLSLFTYFSYIVAKESWQQIDFDTTVKLQDHVSRKYDLYFSYFSLIGSAEITAGFCFIMALLSLIRLKIWPALGWVLIIPATVAEIFGKLVLFHPAPPNFLHRTLLPTGLPSFYVHTDFSYPSGHMTRTMFIATVLITLALIRLKDDLLKFAVVCLLVGLIIIMGVTRVYLGEHWLSDVLGGALLGAGVGFLASLLILRPKLV